MGRYSIYIDESGDFHDDGAGTVLVGGVLFSGSHDEIEPRLKTLLNPIASEFGLGSLDDLHLSEIRYNRGVEFANAINRQVMAKVHSQQYCSKFLAVSTKSKDLPSSKERNYQILLLDLLSMAQMHLSEATSIDVVVATRTKMQNGRLERMTSEEVVRDGVLARLLEGIELGLTARGFWQAKGGDQLNLVMRPASQLAGLKVADFLCNTVLNQSHQSQRELLSSLSEKYERFNAFGSIALRKARIARREFSHVQAMVCYCSLENKDFDDAMRDELSEYLRHLTQSYSPKGLASLIDGALEGLYRQGQFQKNMSKLLQWLKRMLTAAESLVETFPQETLFRITTFLALQLNHSGDEPETAAILEKNRLLAHQLIALPECLPLVLDYRMAEIEFRFNKLDAWESLELSEQYLELLRSYQAVIELVSADGVQLFENSRHFVRGKMNLIRQILSFPTNYQSHRASVPELFQSIRQADLSRKDQQRLAHLEILAMIRSHDYQGIINQLDHMPVETAFDMYWYLRGANEVVLQAPSLQVPDSIGLRVKSIIFTYDIGEVGHPLEVLTRERALYRFLHGQDKAELKKDLKKARSNIQFQAQHSRVIKLIQFTLECYEIAFFQKEFVSNDVTQAYFDISKCTYREEIRTHRDLLAFVRSVMIY